VQRLVRFVLGVAAVLTAIEVAFRIWEPAIAASANRILTKAALLDAQGPVEVLFFGTSQSWDDISPRLFSAQMERLEPGPPVRGFSLAVTSSTLETLEWLARRYGRRAGLRLAVVEVSEPQLQSGLPPWEEPAQPPEDAEERIEDFAARHLRLIQHRGGLRGESLERLPGLLFFAPRLDGSEVLIAEQIAAAMGRPEVNAVHLPVGEVNAVHFAPSATPPPAQDRRALQLIHVASALRQGGVSVVFIVPPLQAARRSGLLRDILPSLSREAPVWDFSQAALPSEMFRDPSHLNHRGRALFSAALAAETARAGVLGVGLARRQ
jgi:hypothetical protein